MKVHDTSTQPGSAGIHPANAAVEHGRVPGLGSCTFRPCPAAHLTSLHAQDPRARLRPRAAAPQSAFMLSVLFAPHTR
eukprot:2125850-Rhodomonas_salina.1